MIARPLMVNGRTGEVIGERPHTAPAKIAIFVLLLLLAALVVYLIAHK